MDESESRLLGSLVRMEWDGSERFGPELGN